MEKVILNKYVTLLKVYQIMNMDYGYSKEKFIQCVSNNVSFKNELTNSATFDKSKGLYLSSMGALRAMCNKAGKPPFEVYSDKVNANKKVLDNYLNMFKSIDDYEMLYNGINIDILKLAIGYKQEKTKKRSK